MRIRCQHNSGNRVISTLSPQYTVAELIVAIIENYPGLSAERINLKIGYPPKSINTQDEEMLFKSIDQIPLQDGDTIIVEELPATTSVPSFSQPRRDVLIRKTIPADNSCLFVAVNFCLNGFVDSECSTSMRELIACLVISQPEVYDEAFLGKPNDEYSKWIQHPEHWGGGIEVYFLSKTFEVEIDVVDTQTLRIDRFGEDQNYTSRILLLYDGIHYDALCKENGSGTGQLTTIFPTADDRVLLEAIEVAQQAKQSRQFTDVANFTLRCEICHVQLKGQKEAQEHAQLTSHTSFGEI